MVDHSLRDTDSESMETELRPSTKLEKDECLRCIDEQGLQDSTVD